MNAALVLERILYLGWLLLFVAGGINGIYICFHGIRRLDPYFSRLPNVKWESYSPFDTFCRMHRYSFLYAFGLTRPKVSRPITAWLYFTCITLTVYWISMFIGFLRHQFDINIIS